jgi:hypothetical protein
MSTRGAIGFKQKGELKVTYNHFDSYMSGLGVSILNEIKQIQEWEVVKKNVNKIKLVEDDKKPTKKHLETFNKYSNTSVGGPISNTTVQSYYQLLREIQGTLVPYMNGEVNIMVDSADFVKDTLFCEYCYIVDLDNMKFEAKNNYNGKVFLFDLNNLPTKEDFLKETEEEE